ncbi:sigma factor [Anaerocolumna jejuensis]|uniref:sigma factor n=1 Tax=Anaerocolumna jejuensis TaxID=259063 RepID=UPI003F7B8AF3
MEASQNENVLNTFIEQNERNILHIASKVSGHYITKSDDEWAIALTAFVQAVKEYDGKKGNFLSFAKMVVQRRLIDYFRQQSKYKPELAVNPVAFDMESEEEEDNTVRHAVTKKSMESGRQESLAFEIRTVNENLKEYGFSFFDLTKCSPKAAKTKIACGKVINFCIQDPMVVKVLKNTKLLPVKILEKNTKVPRKIIERHRKYIIAAIVILSGEYLELAEYLRYIREEKIQ